MITFQIYSEAMFCNKLVQYIESYNIMISHVHVTWHREACVMDLGSPWWNTRINLKCAFDWFSSSLTMRCPNLSLSKVIHHMYMLGYRRENFKATDQPTNKMTKLHAFTTYPSVIFLTFWFPHHNLQIWKLNAFFTDMHLTPLNQIISRHELIYLLWELIWRQR